MAEVQYTGDEVLDIMSQYAPNRNRGIEQLIRKAFDLQPGVSLLEFGAGKGEFINRFADQEIETLVVEQDPAYLAELSQRHKSFQDLALIPDETIDYLYLIDVLEHLDDDQASRIHSTCSCFLVCQL